MRSIEWIRIGFENEKLWVGSDQNSIISQQENEL